MVLLSETRDWGQGCYDSWGVWDKVADRSELQRRSPDTVLEMPLGPWLNHKWQSIEQDSDCEGQGGLVCCSPWGSKETDAAEGLNNNNRSLAEDRSWEVKC